MTAAAASCGGKCRRKIRQQLHGDSANSVEKNSTNFAGGWLEYEFGVFRLITSWLSLKGETAIHEWVRLNPASDHLFASSSAPQKSPTRMDANQG